MWSTVVMQSGNIVLASCSIIGFWLWKYYGPKDSITLFAIEMLCILLGAITCVFLNDGTANSIARTIFLNIVAPATIIRALFALNVQLKQQSDSSS